MNKEQIKKIHTKHEGITLIALVITILVLIILAGVSIQTLSGNNGIISKAKTSSSANKYSAILERLNLELNNLLVPTASNDYNYTGKVTLREYVDALKNQDVDGITLMEDDESNIDSFNIESGSVTFTIGGYVYEIDVEKIENVDESITDEFSKYYVIGSGYIAKESETGPNLRITSTSTSDKITVGVKYSNIDEKGSFKYYYKLQEEDDTKYKLAITQTGVKDNPTTYTFEGLTQDKIYDIKIEATNSNKITTTKILEKTTGKVTVAQGNIDFGEVTWNTSTHRASVPITKGAGITESIQYQIGSASGTWQNGETVAGIQNGQTVYARLWDGTNGGETISVEITDTKNPQSATIALSATSVIKGVNFTARVTHTDNESGVNITQCKYVLNTDSNTTIAESTYTSAFSSNDQTITLNSGTKGTYYLHVLTVDSAGNKIQTRSSAISITEPVYTWAQYQAVSTIVWNYRQICTWSDKLVYVLRRDECSGKNIDSAGYRYGDGADLNAGVFLNNGMHLVDTWANYEKGTYYWFPVASFNGFFPAVQNGLTNKAIRFAGTNKSRRTNMSSSTYTSSWVDAWEMFQVSSSFSRGNFIKNITSSNSSAYPANGYQSGYWYVKQ